MQIFKRKGRPGYYARWQIGGEDFVRGTGETSRAKALEALHRFVSEGQSNQTISQPFHQLLALLEDPAHLASAVDHVASAKQILIKVLNALPPEERAVARDEIARELLAEQDRKVRIDDGWSEWRRCANRESEPKTRTLAGYEAMWRRFQAWASNAKIAFLHEVTRSHAEDYAADLWGSSVSPSTFNQHLKFIRSLFTTLEARAGLLSNPWAHLKTRKRALDEGRRNLTEAELRIVLNRAEGNLKLMLHLGLFTGLRLGDVVNLRWENVEFDPVLRQARPGFIVLVPLKTSRYGKKLEVPIHPSLAELLRQHRTRYPQGDLLFPAESREYATNTANVSQPIQRFLESCGLETTEKATHGHRRRAIVRVGFHSLRHSFVSLCAKAKTPLHIVQRLVGHGSPLLTSEVYLHLDTEQKQEAIASLPSITVES